MIYDLSKKIDRVRFKKRYDYLSENGKVVVLEQKRAIRSLSQNNYLHLILTWFGIETGYTLAESKEIYKRVNKDIYTTYIKKGVKFTRSSSDLNKDEMSLSIERFRNYSSEKGSIYLPSANEGDFLTHIRNESMKYQNRVYS